MDQSQRKFLSPGKPPGNPARRLRALPFPGSNRRTAGGARDTREEGGLGRNRRARRSRAARGGGWW